MQHAGKDVVLEKLQAWDNEIYEAIYLKVCRTCPL